MKKIVAIVLAMVMVMGLATTAMAATAAQTDKAENVAAITKTTAVKQDLAPQVDAAKSFATYGLLITETATKQVTTVNNLVMVPTKLNATWTYVNGTEVIYFAETEGVQYWDEKAVAVDIGYDLKEYAKCGTFYVDDVKEVDTYYLFEKKFYAEVETEKFATATDMIFNVDGKVVLATPVDNIHYADHAYKFDSVKTNAAPGAAVSKVYCSACGKVFDFVDGDEEKAVKTFGANYAKTEQKGYIGMIYVAKDAVASAPAAGTTTETVESAKTFDAGIAMYVGMSVMAAAGSAVVLKKKD